MHSPSPLDQNLFIKKKKKTKLLIAFHHPTGIYKVTKNTCTKVYPIKWKWQAWLQQISTMFTTHVWIYKYPNSVLTSFSKKKKKKITQIQHYSLASFSFTQRSKYRVCNQNRIKQYNTYLKPRKKISSYKNQSSKSSIILFKYNCYLLNMGQGVCSFLRTETQCLINGWGGTNTWK